MKLLKRHHQAGLSLVELIIVIGITVAIIAAVYTAMQYSMFLVANSQARMSALSLATDRMEYFRSLSYDAVGTAGGPIVIPGGLPNTSTQTLNGIEFTETLRVFYVNDPGDDVAGVDSNGFINDYKKVEIEMAWTLRGETSSVVFTSNIVPVSVETDEGYGAVKIEVYDEATGLTMPGATVRITNDGSGTAPAQDFSVTTGANGVALVSVLAGNEYHASATAAGYSFDTTYRVTGSNPNPSPNSFTVVEALIADRPFRIGELSDFSLDVYSDITEGAVTEPFVDGSGIAVSSNVTVDGAAEELKLTDLGGGVYPAAGDAELVRIVPALLRGWETAVVVGDSTGGAYNVQFYTGDCAVSCALVSDTDLPGNSTGITDRIINLSNIDASTHPDLTVRVNLSGDTTNTPSVSDVAVYYRSSAAPSVGTAIAMRGEKIIGTTPNVYKTDRVETTDASGEIDLTDIEYDQYTLLSTGLTPTRICTDAVVDYFETGVNFAHEAGVDSELELVLKSTSAHTLLVNVSDSANVPLPGVTVAIDNGGFSDTVTTDSCGQAFIDGAANATDYDLDISRVGYTTDSRTDFTVDGETKLSVVLSES